MKAEIFGDGKTVWVNSSNGCCIGRFSRFGVDIHKDIEAQRRDGTECLDCFPRTFDLDHDWNRFKEAMKVHYGVTVPDKHKPAATPWVVI